MTEGTSDASQPSGQITAIGLQIKTTGGMKYRRVGKSGLTVSEMGVGCFSFGDFVETKAAEAVVHYAMAQGINYFDTADSYGIGVSEQKLGAALVGRRDKAVIATKFSNRMDHGPNDIGTSRLHIVRACEASLRRLKTDYIDLYQVYSLLYRDIEKRMEPFCVKYGIGMNSYFPLAGGLLTGIYKRDAAATPGTRAAASPNYAAWNSKRNWDVQENLKAFAEQRGWTLPQMSLAWLLSRPAMSTIIAGADRTEHIAQNIKALEIKFTPDDLIEIDRLTLVDEDRSVAPVYRKLRPEKVHELEPMHVVRIRS